MDTKTTISDDLEDTERELGLIIDSHREAANAQLKYLIWLAIASIIYFSLGTALFVVMGLNHHG